MSWLQDFSNVERTSSAFREWAEGQPTAAAAWDSCPRADWQLWLAGHAPNPTSDDEHAILRSALEHMPESTLHWIVSGFRLLPTTMDALDAWTAKRRGKLGLQSGLAASSAAFMIALLLGVAIDRAAGACLGAGTTRFWLQSAIVIALLVPLSPLLRTIWRALLDRRVAQLSFASAFAEIHDRYSRITERASVSERGELAGYIRTALYGLSTRAFSGPPTS